MLKTPSAWRVRTSQSRCRCGLGTRRSEKTPTYRGAYIRILCSAPRLTHRSAYVSQVHYLSTGYASAVAHTFADEAECVTTAKRSSLTHLLSPEQADNIGAVRISAAGWEG